MFSLQLEGPLKVLATNRGKVIDRRDPNAFKEVNAQARRLEVIGSKPGAVCRALLVSLES